MRAVLYARYSSDNQRYGSISGQFHCSEEYCKRKGYNIVHYNGDCDVPMVRKDKLEYAIYQMFIDSFLMEMVSTDTFLRDFFTSLNIKVVVNKINAEIQLNLSVFPSW